MTNTWRRWATILSVTVYGVLLFVLARAAGALILIPVGLAFAAGWWWMARGVVRRSPHNPGRHERGQP